jgi:hypothetical protein
MSKDFCTSSNKNCRNAADLFRRGSRRGRQVGGLASKANTKVLPDTFV